MKRASWCIIAAVAITYSATAQQQQTDSARHPITPSNQHPGEQPVDPATLSQKLPHIEVMGGAVAADFGRVLPGDMYKQFTVRNNGTATLVFYGNNNSCDNCVSYDYDKGSLEPGDTMQMTMHWTLETTNGAINSFAVINSNDPQTPRLEVPVHIEVYRDVTMNPPTATIQDFRPCKDECHFTFELKNTGDSAVEISDPVLTKVEGMEVRFVLWEGLTMNLKPGETYKLDAYVKITEQPHDARQKDPNYMFVPHAEAEIHTSSKATPIVAIPFYYLISGK